jgi:hypothetical protein
MESTHTSSLDIPELSEAASVAHVFPAMAKTHYFQSENYTMKDTLSLLKLMASQFSTALEMKS